VIVHGETSSLSDDGPMMSEYNNNSQGQKKSLGVGGPNN